MKSWKVTNLLPTSLTVEDIGVTVQAKGGKDSSVIITDLSYLSSSDLRALRASRSVSVTPVSKGPIIWPTMFPPKNLDSIPPSSQPPPSSTESPDSLRNTIKQLEKKVDRLVGILSSPPVRPSPNSEDVTPDTISGHSYQSKNFRKKQKK